MMKKVLLFGALLLTLSSCILDTKPRSYCVKNCTQDTLLITLTESDTLSDEMYWGIHPGDTIDLLSTDTTSVYVHGKKVIFLNYYYVQPGAEFIGDPLLNKDTGYVYAIKWKIATSYSFEEIRVRKLYDRRVVAKKDFRNHLFEYKTSETLENSSQR